MRLNRLLILSLVFSIAFLLGIGSCQNGPKIPVYVSNPNAKGMDYSFPGDQGEKGFVPYEKTDKFVCFAPVDAQTLITYCRVSKEQQQSIGF